MALILTMSSRGLGTPLCATFSLASLHSTIEGNHRAKTGSVLAIHIPPLKNRQEKPFPNPIQTSDQGFILHELRAVKGG